MVAGAATRSGSVRAGLAAVPDEAEVVVVHDAARPLAGACLFRAVVEAVDAGADAAVPGCRWPTPCAGGRAASSTATGWWRCRPPGVPGPALRAAHAGGGEATDDATLVEAQVARWSSCPARPPT